MAPPPGQGSGRRKTSSLFPPASIVFALVAALYAFYPLAYHTYNGLLSQGSHATQPEVDPNLPVPRALLWNPTVRYICTSIALLTPPAQLALAVALFCLGTYALLRALNPTFRLTTGVDWNETVLVRTYMHTVPVIKAFLIAMAGFLPLFIVWLVLDWIGHGAVWMLWGQLAIVGAATWLLFSRDGVAGNYEEGGYELPRDPRARRSLLVRGVLAGTAVWLPIAIGSHVTAERLIEFYHAMGGVGQAQWWGMAAMLLLPVAAIGFGIGGVFYALGAPGMRPANRARAAIFPLVVLLAGMYAGRTGIPSMMRDRFDWRPGDQVGGSTRLAQEAGLPSGAPGTELALVLGSAGGFPVKFAVQSVVGVDASPDSAHRIEEFLRRKRYVTGLSYVAYVTLHDASSLQWNPAETLRVCLLNLEHECDPAYLGHFIDRLSSCAGTPDTRAYVDRLADEQLFAYLQRGAQVFTGDMYSRFGEGDKATAWYRRAEMPPTQIDTRLEERNGHLAYRVTGRLLLNGKAVAGANVGLMPLRALPQLRDLMHPDGYVSPFWLSRLEAGAKTDATGRFTLDNVGPQPGRLMVGFDPATSAPLLSSTAPGKLISVHHSTDIVVPGQVSQTTSVGDIDVVLPP